MTATHARLFFALWPDAQARAALVQWQRAVQPLCGGRAMHPDDVHLTLAFLGDTPIELLTPIKSVASAVSGEPFALRVNQLRYWKHNRIVWAGLEDEPGALTALVDDLRAKLRAAGIRFDVKAFVPHITLFRNARAMGPWPVLPAIDWHVDGFALIRATGHKRPRYGVEARWSL